MVNLKTRFLDSLSTYFHFFSFDRSVKPLSYTLVHYSAADLEALRNWFVCSDKFGQYSPFKAIGRKH